MRTSNKKTARTLGPAIIATTAVVTAALALNILARLAQTTPHVGDIVAFPASTIRSYDDGTRLLVHRQDQFGCVLDLNVLRRSGGSLVLETRFGGEISSFRAHWAGARTSDDPGNCGSDAELVLDRLDLDALALAARGYGIHPAYGAPVFTSDINIAN
jgi:hypothetical protein